MNFQLVKSRYSKKRNVLVVNFEDGECGFIDTYPSIILRLLRLPDYEITLKNTVYNRIPLEQVKSNYPDFNEDHGVSLEAVALLIGV
jgi:hypothetical protein